MTLTNMKYNDQYSTCNSTYATLRLFHVDLQPKEIDSFLGINATSSHKCGDPISHKFSEKGKRKQGGWFLESEGRVESKDTRRHIDWLLDQIENKTTILKELQAKGYKIDISCYWDSANGHGGPTVSPAQSRRLADLGVELWFDVYFSGEE